MAEKWISDTSGMSSCLAVWRCYAVRKRSAAKLTRESRVKHKMEKHNYQCNESAWHAQKEFQISSGSLNKWERLVTMYALHWKFSMSKLAMNQELLRPFCRRPCYNWSYQTASSRTFSFSLVVRQITGFYDNNSPTSWGGGLGLMWWWTLFLRSALGSKSTYSCPLLFSFDTSFPASSATTSSLRHHLPWAWHMQNVEKCDSHQEVGVAELRATFQTVGGVVYPIYSLSHYLPVVKDSCWCCGVRTPGLKSFQEDQTTCGLV